MTELAPSNPSATTSISWRGYGIIGYGRITRRIARLLSQEADAPKLAAILVRERSRLSAIAEFGDHVVCTTLSEFIERQPSVAVEGASATTLAEYGAPLLAAGIDLMPLSLGAFADPAIEQTLTRAAATGPGRLEIPAGALGSLGFIAAGRDCGLRQVVLRATYPVARWRLMGAERFVDLDSVTRPTLFLTGTAREIANQFPGHLNVSVAVALAGLGLDNTQVELVADPFLTQAEFEVSTIADAGSVSLRVGGRDAPVEDDPIDYTAFSIMRLLRRREASIAI